MIAGVFPACFQNTSKGYVQILMKLSGNSNNDADGDVSDSIGTFTLDIPKIKRQRPLVIEEPVL